jgi:hypothetical protein
MVSQDLPKTPRYWITGSFQKIITFPIKAKKRGGDIKEIQMGFFLSRTLVVVVFATLDGFSFDPRGRVKNQQN